MNHLHCLIVGTANRIPKAYKNPGKEQTCALVAFQLFKDCHGNFVAVGDISRRSIDMLSQPLDMEFASHFKGRRPLLLAKVKY